MLVTLRVSYSRQSAPLTDSVFRTKNTWKSNQYRKIVFTGKTPLKMDDNWLLLEDSKAVYWWNCHTQQLSGPQFRPPLGQIYELHLLPNYTEGQFPSYIITLDRSAYIVEGDKMTKCRALQDFSDIHNITVIKGNRVAVNRRSSTVLDIALKIPNTNAWVLQYF